MSKSDKIRQLIDKGLSNSEIQTKTGFSAQLIHIVNKSYKKKKKKVATESRKEVLNRTMKKPSKIIAAVKEMKTALDFLEKERADEFNATSTLPLKIRTRRFTKEEINALDKDWVEFPKDHVVGSDRVNSPPHYTAGGIETIDFIEAKDLNYRLGNVIKYVSRAEKKDNPLEDLRKAKWYLEREIAARERA